MNNLVKLVLSIMSCLFIANTALADDKVTLGWLEFVRIQGADLRMDAKLDTGAKTSSFRA